MTDLAKNVDTILAETEFKIMDAGHKTTVVTAILPGGFEITASSSAADASKYNQATGAAECRNKIIDRLFELEAYRISTTDKHG